MTSDQRFLISRRTFSAGLLSLTVSPGMGQAIPESPVIFWKVDPVGPGQTLLLFGNGLADARVRGARLSDVQADTPGVHILTIPASAQNLSILQAGNQCLKIEIPRTWQPGAYVIYVETQAGSIEPIVVNRPQVWWALGDCGTAATPGSEIRVFGKNFTMNRKGAWAGKAALRDSAGISYTLKVTALNPYGFAFQLPREVAAGQSDIFVHNGHGGRAGWSDSLTLEIKSADAWPSTVFNVHSFGAKGDSITDDTNAIRAALGKSRTQGGGVVFLPRGIYRVTGQLTIPPRTVLRGESRDLAWLMVPPEVPEFNTLLAGASEFGVEDLSMVARMPLRMIVAPDVPSMYTEYKPWGIPGASRVHDVFLRRLRIQHIRYQGRVGSVTADPRRSEVAGPSTIALAGSNLEILDSDIVSSGMPFVLHDIHSARVLRNHLHVGRNGWYGFWGARQTVFEGNIIQGQDLEASYGGFGNYSATDGTDVSQIYIADNKFLDSFGGEREALTFDSPGNYPWKGHISQAGAKDLSVDGVAWQVDAFRGLACIIAAGKGLGQHRRIVSNTTGRLLLDTPWDVIPDSSSVASIGSFRRDVVVYCNESQDAGVGVQLWGGGYNFIIDGNSTVRSGGMYGTAAEYNRPNSDRQKQTFLPLYFTQWLNNTVKQPIAYADGQNSESVTMWGCLGLFSRDTVATPEAAVLILGNLMRGNHLFDGPHFVLSYFGNGHRGNARNALMKGRLTVGLDNVIEDNSVTDASIGIEVEPGYQGTLVRDNHFERVGEPLREGKWRDETK